VTASKANIKVSPSEKHIGNLLTGKNNGKVVSFNVDIPAWVEPGPLTFNIIIRQDDFPIFTAQQRMMVNSSKIVALPPDRVGREGVQAVKRAEEENIDEVPFLPDFQRKNAYAIVIGIENYKRKEVSQISFARTDAKTVRDYLTNIGGFPKDNVQKITDEDATLSEMRRLIKEWLKSKANKDSLIFVYFSGHGIPELASKSPYLLPYDGSPNAVISTAYAVSELKADMNYLPTKNVVIVIDSCYSGQGRSITSPGARGAFWVEADNTPTQAVMISSSKADQSSWDYPAKNHGLFTYFMLKGMRGKDADINGDGYVDVEELYSYLQEHVPIAAQQIRNMPQNPVKIGNGSAIKLTKTVDQ
jgi:uncharacterized caspase-like protein